MLVTWERNDCISSKNSLELAEPKTTTMTCQNYQLEIISTSLITYRAVPSDRYFLIDPRADLVDVLRRHLLFSWQTRTVVANNIKNRACLSVCQELFR